MKLIIVILNPNGTHRLATCEQGATSPSIFLSRQLQTGLE